MYQTCYGINPFFFFFLIHSLHFSFKAQKGLKFPEEDESQQNIKPTTTITPEPKKENGDPFSIHISELKKYIETAAFEKEYQVMDQKSQFQYSFEAANSNKIRNRYSNVLARNFYFIFLKNKKNFSHIFFHSSLQLMLHE